MPLYQFLVRKTDKLQIVLIFSLFLAIIFCYRNVFNGFFQHDEWIAFGDMFSRKTDFISVLTGFFAPAKEHYIPLFQIIFYTYIKLFKFNFDVYAFLSILFHLIVVLFVYLFSLRMFNNKGLAFITCAFFGLCSGAYQATSWVLYDIAPHYAEIFALFSLIYFWDFLRKERLNILYLSILFLTISLFIKEVAVGFFVLYPVTIILFKGWNFRKQVKYFRPILIVGLLYLMIRIPVYFIPNAWVNNPTVFELQRPVNIAVNMALYPSKAFFQTVFPARVNLIFSKWLTGLLPRNLTGPLGTTQFDIFTEQKTLQIVSLALFLLAIFWVYRLWQHGKHRVFVKYVIFGLLFVTVNSFIYAFASGKSGLVSLAESRNLYLQSIGTAIFLVSLAVMLFKNSLFRIVIFVLPIILLHTFYLNKEVTNLASIGIVRKNILYQIKRDYPKLPPKVIFYTESDTSYYGMPETEKMLPFEVGLGRTLLSWYQLEEKFPGKFFEDRFLWHPTSQGYVEEGNRGFGYFRNIDLVIQLFKDKNLSPDFIVAYRFDSADNSLTDITDEIRTKIEKMSLKLVK